MASANDAEEPAAMIRVGIANLSGVLLELVMHMIAQQPDMLLVGQVDTPVEALLELGRGVDVLILGAPVSQPPPGICSHLLSEYPYLKILVLAIKGDAAALYWLGLRRRQVAPLSTEQLLTSIRTAYNLNPVV